MFRQHNSKSSYFLMVIMAVLLVTSLITIISLRTDSIEEHLKDDRLLNVLFVLEQNGRPLSTNVLLYYPELKRSALFDIPGNTGLIIKSLGRVDKIEAVYVERGIESYRNEIQNLTGITIPFTITFTLDDFSVLTDLLGGFKIFIPEPIDITGPDEQRYLLPSGVVTLDGDKMKTYLSYPVLEGMPSDMQERRQNSMLAFFQALKKSAGVISNKSVFKVLNKHLKTNLQPRDMQKLLGYISSVDAERLLPQTITGTQREVDGAILLFPFYDGQLIKDIVKQSITAMVSTDGEGQARIYVLEVQNGTTTPGLARNTSILYQGFGYDVLSTVNANRSDYAQTILVDHIGNEAAAKQIADIIRCNNIITAEVDDDQNHTQAVSPVDFSLILGKDFDGRYVR